MIAEELDRIEARLCAITDTIVITNRDEAKRASRLWDWAVNHGQPLIAALRESMAPLKEAREIIANLLDLDVEDVSPTAVWDRAEAFLKETE